MVRPALQEQPFGGGPIPLLLMEKRQVHAGARQAVLQVRLVGEVGRQLLVDAQGLVVVLLRLLEPARRSQQNAPVVVASGQLLAELGSGGEVGRQLLLDTQGLVEVLLRLLEPARVTQHIAPVVVAYGQVLAELGSGGEVGRQLLLDAQGLARSPAPPPWAGPSSLSRRPRLLWLPARSWRNSGREGKSAASCFWMLRAWS